MKRTRVAALVIAVVLLVAVGGWTVRGFHRATGVQVVTAPVSTGAVVRRIVAAGTLQAVTTVQVGAQVSGTIQSLGADYNSIVRKGQVLAKLDPALFEAALGQAKAMVAQAQATEAQATANRSGFATAVEDARTKLTRAEELAAKQLIPQSDLDAARIAMGEANADLKSGESQVVQAAAAMKEAKAGIDQAQVNLEHTTVTSPIDGIVVARSVDVGQTVASAFQAPVLFMIAADLTRMQVEVDIDEADIGGVRPGEPVAFSVESYPGETFHGTVSAVRLQPVTGQTAAATAAGAPTTGTSTASASTPTSASTMSPPTAPNGTVITYATMVDVSNPDEKLRPGMTATVTLDGSRRENAVRIPNDALLFCPSLEVMRSVRQAADSPAASPETANDPAARRVWRFDGARFMPIDVHIGLADGQWTELLSGPLHSGDALVTSASVGIAASH